MSDPTRPAGAPVNAEHSDYYQRTYGIDPHPVDLDSAYVQRVADQTKVAYGDVALVLAAHLDNVHRDEHRRPELKLLPVDKYGPDLRISEEKLSEEWDG